MRRTQHTTRSEWEATTTAAVVTTALCGLALPPDSPAYFTMLAAAGLAAAGFAAVLLATDQTYSVASAVFGDSHQSIRIFVAIFGTLVLLDPTTTVAGLAERFVVAFVVVALFRAGARVAHHRRSLGVTDDSEAMVSVIVSGLRAPYDQDADQ